MRLIRCINLSKQHLKKLPFFKSKVWKNFKWNGPPWCKKVSSEEEIANPFFNDSCTLQGNLTPKAWSSHTGLDTHCLSSSKLIIKIHKLKRLISSNFSLHLYKMWPKFKFFTLSSPLWSYSSHDASFNDVNFSVKSHVLRMSSCYKRKFKEKNSGSQVKWVK